MGTFQIGQHGGGVLVLISLAQIRHILPFLLLMVHFGGWREIWKSEMSGGIGGHTLDFGVGTSGR